MFLISYHWKIKVNSSLALIRAWRGFLTSYLEGFLNVSTSINVLDCSYDLKPTICTSDNFIGFCVNRSCRSGLDGHIVDALDRNDIDSDHGSTVRSPQSAVHSAYLLYHMLYSLEAYECGEFVDRYAIWMYVCMYECMYWSTPVHSNGNKAPSWVWYTAGSIIAICPMCSIISYALSIVRFSLR